MVIMIEDQKPGVVASNMSFEIIVATSQAYIGLQGSIPFFLFHNFEDE